MLRALLALGGTAAGIAALVAVKFHPAAATAAAGQPLTAPSATVQPAGTPRAGTPSAGSRATGKPASSASPRGTSGGSSGGAASTTARTFTGAVDNTSYGPMQVAITVAGKTITKVTVVQQTNTGSQSSSIDAMALPKLTSEALTAQSAKIDAVSGASYTSAGYIKSLQSAIDQAGL